MIAMAGTHLILLVFPFLFPLDFGLCFSRYGISGLGMDWNGTRLGKDGTGVLITFFLSLHLSTHDSCYE
jgi:hypothetical protein